MRRAFIIVLFAIMVNINNITYVTISSAVDYGKYSYMKRILFLSHHTFEIELYVYLNILNKYAYFKSS